MPVFKPQIIHRSFSDFEELADNLQGWNLEICKLDTVPFHGKISQLLTPDFILSRGRFNCRTKQTGEPPVGYRTIGIPAHPGFDIFTLSIAEDLLEKFIEMRRFKSVEVLPCNPDTMALLRPLLYKSLQGVEYIEGLKTTILYQLAQLMAEGRPHSFAVLPRSRRIQAILQTEGFIMANPTEPATVKALCKITGMSERSLEYAFDHHLGIGPKAYINAVRLNGARKQLRVSHPGKIRVADAANAWGFWHMGQFAADYRKHFGENPSETLKTV